MSIIPILKELLKPELKCNRIGHNYKPRQTVIRKISTRFVCEDFSCIIERCSRCGNTKEPTNLKHIDGYSSVTMPKPMWDKMYKHKYIEVR